MAAPVRNEDPGPVVFEWTSPAFSTTAPELRNATLIPPGVALQMAPAWSTRHYPHSQVRLHCIRDAYVVGEGLVFDRDLRVRAVSMTQHTADEAGRALQALQNSIAGGTVVEDTGVTMLCQKRGMANFGHWLIELLPIAHLASPWLMRREWTLLAPGLPGAMGGVVRDSLALLGLPGGAIRFGDGAPRHCAEVLVVEGLTAHGAMISPLVMDCMDAVMAGVVADDPAPLWVARPGSPRALWNEAEVAACLATLGWCVMDPSALPLRSQIARFRGATAVAGVHGAGLTGIVFAPGGTPVTSFAPAGMPDTFFWLLSMLRGHRYIEVRAPHDLGRAGTAPWDASLVLSLPEVLTHLGVP